MAYRRHCEEHLNDDEGHFILGTLQMLLNQKNTLELSLKIQIIAT